MGRDGEGGVAEKQVVGLSKGGERQREGGGGEVRLTVAEREKWAIHFTVFLQQIKHCSEKWKVQGTIRQHLKHSDHKTWFECALFEINIVGFCNKHFVSLSVSEYLLYKSCGKYNFLGTNLFNIRHWSITQPEYEELSLVLKSCSAPVVSGLLQYSIFWAYLTVLRH